MTKYTPAELVAILNSDIEEPPSDPSPRKRGGQPGNRNALKHGFYARSFTPTDRKDLDHHHFSDLQDEITMLRVFIRRVLELSGGLQDLPQAVDMLRVLSLASIGLTRLMRTSHIIAPPNNDLADAFNHLLDQVNKELRAEDNPLDPDFTYTPL